MKKYIVVILILALILSLLLGLGIGAFTISLSEIWDTLLAPLNLNSSAVNTTTYQVFWFIRMPRVLMAVLIGATLAVAGVGFQGMFRNPLADAGLIGVSSGASLAAIVAIVLGGTLFLNIQTIFGKYFLSIAAFVGAFVSMTVVYRLSKSQGKTQIAIMLLAGIAINAIVGAVSGMITLAANDEQLRSITFWTLGSLGGASWLNIMALLPFAVITCIVIPLMGKSLNAMSLGEQDANSMGIPIERVKTIVMVVCAMGVGACVAVSGIIGFLGLLVPHIFRLILGPEHKRLAVVSALGGALLLVLSDLFSRTIIAPIELPIGIVTSVIGGPFFLYLLLKEKGKQLF